MSYPTNLMKELRSAPDHQLLNHLFPSQAVSQLSSNYHSIHEAIFLSSPEELAALDGAGNQSVRKILAFRELSNRLGKKL